MRDLDKNTSTASSWLTVREAADYLGVSEPTLRKWTDAGSIAVFRTPGRHRRYRVEDLDRFRDQHVEHSGA